MKCQLCGGKHSKILCYKNNNQKSLQEINVFSKYHGVDEIILQTLIVMLGGPNAKQGIRALIDSGSGRSYITSQAVKNFGFDSVGTIEMAHNLFGGIITNSTRRSVHRVDVSNIENTFQRQCQLIEVDTICGPICPTPRGAWLEDLAAHDIHLSDFMENECPIHILFGGDIASRLYT